MPPTPPELVVTAMERWHSMPRRYLPPLARADYIDTGDKQYVRMFAANDELIGVYEVKRDGQLASLSKPWPIGGTVPAATYRPE